MIRQQGPTAARYPTEDRPCCEYPALPERGQARYRTMPKGPNARPRRHRMDRRQRRSCSRGPPTARHPMTERPLLRPIPRGMRDQATTSPPKANRGTPGRAAVRTTSGRRKPNRGGGQGKDDAQRTGASPEALRWASGVPIPNHSSPSATTEAGPKCFLHYPMSRRPASGYTDRAGGNVSPWGGPDQLRHPEACRPPQTFGAGASTTTLPRSPSPRSPIPAIGKPKRCANPMNPGLTPTMRQN